MVKKSQSGQKKDARPDVNTAPPKQAVKTLEMEHGRAQQYLEIAGVIMVSIAPDQSITMINRKGCELLGYPREDLIGKNWFDVILPENERAEIKALFARLIKGELEPIEYVENHVVTSVGEKRLISWHNTLVRDAKGNITGSLSSGEDITDRRQAEQALNENESRLRGIVENAQAGYFFIDSEGIFRQVNDAWLHMHGYQSRDEVIGKHLALTQVEADMDKANQNVAMLLSGNPIPTGEFSRRCKDGSVGYHTFSAHPVRQAGQVVGLEGFIIDTTVSRRSQESLLRLTQLNQEVISSAGEGIIVYDRQLCYILWNSFMENLTGLTAGDVLGKCALDVFPHLREQGVDRLLERALAGETVRSGDQQFRAPASGRSGWTVATYTPHRNMDGEITGVIGIIQDISERRREQDRRDLALKIMNLLNVTDSQPDLIGGILSLIKDFSGCEAVGIRLKQGDDYPYYEARGFVTGHVELENQLCAYDENGQLLRDSEGNPVLECMCGNILQGRFDPSKPFFTRGGSFWSNCTTELLASTTDEDRQARTRNKCNGEGYESVALIPMIGGGGGNIGLLQLNDARRDRFTPDLIAFYESLADNIGIVIARRQAEEALIQVKEKYHTVADFTLDWEYWMSPQGSFIYISPSCKSLTGYEVESFMQDPDLLLKITHPEDRDRLALHINKSVASGTRCDPLDFRIITREGDERWIGHRCQPVFGSDGKPLGVRGSNRDITRRKQAEQALGYSEERFRTLYENAPTLIDAFDNNGRCVLWNKECQKVFGWTIDEINAHAEPLALFYPNPDVRKEVIATVTSQPGNLFREWHPVTKDGKVLTVLWANFQLPGGEVINIGHDISDRKRLEDEQQKVAKLEAIGLLAAGIAHNFNNILTVILGNISIAKMDAKPGSETHDVLEQAEKASLQAKDLTAQLLTFSKGGEPVRKMAPLSELLKATAIDALRGTSVKCHLSLAADLMQAEIDQVQVSQVIHNVVLNAQQSMPAGGTIELAAENVTVNPGQDSETDAGLKAGDYVRIRVTDHGGGIPEQDMNRIFDPFFTTKVKAIGLGLATSYSIVRRHGGRISVQSKAGAGSTVSLYLPAAGDSARKP